MAPILVVWEDAYAASGLQCDSPTAALETYKPTIRKTIGYWIGRAQRNGGEAVVIATDDDRSADAPHAIGGIFYTPSAMVRRIEPLCAAPRATRRKKRG